jgi:hypothetical protein
MWLERITKTIHRPTPEMLILMKTASTVRTQNAAGRQVLLVRSSYNQGAARPQQTMKLSERGHEMFVKKMLDHFHA